MKCGQCNDYVRKSGKGFCSIRFILHKDGLRDPMPVSMDKKACVVFRKKI